MDSLAATATIWIGAQRERVWQAITSPTQIGLWWTPGPWEIPVLKVGETLKFGAAPHTSLATIEVVDPPRQFAFRWHPNLQAGMPGMLTTLLLEEENGGTRVTASQSGFEHLPAETRQQQLDKTAGGYRSVTENLKNLLERPDA
jgi:uncharacterized protein YndB with AHSA1/START domain